MNFFMNVLIWSEKWKALKAISSFSLFILKREGVNGFAMNVDAHYFKACCYYVHEGSSRPGVLSNVHPLSLSYMLLTKWVFKYLICPHSLSYLHSLKDSLFAWSWVLLSFPFSPPLSDALFYWWFASYQKNSLHKGWQQCFFLANFHTVAKIYVYSGRQVIKDIFGKYMSILPYLDNRF